MKTMNWFFFKWIICEIFLELTYDFLSISGLRFKKDTHYLHIRFWDQVFNNLHYNTISKQFCFCSAWDYNQIGTYPFTHEAIVQWQANELECSFLDEVRVENSHLGGFPGHILGHRLPKALWTLLKSQRPKDTIFRQVFIKTDASAEYKMSQINTFCQDGHY